MDVLSNYCPVAGSQELFKIYKENLLKLNRDRIAVVYWIYLFIFFYYQSNYLLHNNEYLLKYNVRFLTGNFREYQYLIT